MKTLNIKILKSDVLHEVALATAYIGAKKSDDGVYYDRISTIDEDEQALDRFWLDCRRQMHALLKDYLVNVNNNEKKDFDVDIEVPGNMPETNADPLTGSLKGFCVNHIITRWCVYTNKEDVESYGASASENYRRARELLYSRRFVVE